MTKHLESRTQELNREKDNSKSHRDFRPRWHATNNLRMCICKRSKSPLLFLTLKYKSSNNMSIYPFETLVTMQIVNSKGEL